MPPALEAATLLGAAKLIVAEHNTGFLWQGFPKVLWKRFKNISPGRIAAVNALDSGRPHFIQPATYEQLLDCYGLSPRKLALRVKQELQIPV